MEFNRPSTGTAGPNLEDKYLSSAHSLADAGVFLFVWALRCVSSSSPVMQLPLQGTAIFQTSKYLYVVNGRKVAFGSRGPNCPSISLNSLMANQAQMCYLNHENRTERYRWHTWPQMYQVPMSCFGPDQKKNEDLIFFVLYLSSLGCSPAISNSETLSPNQPDPCQKYTEVAIQSNS